MRNSKLRVGCSFLRRVVMDSPDHETGHNMAWSCVAGRPLVLVVGCVAAHVLVEAACVVKIKVRRHHRTRRGQTACGLREISVTILLLNPSLVLNPNLGPWNVRFNNQWPVPSGRPCRMVGPHRHAALHRPGGRFALYYGDMDYQNGGTTNISENKLTSHAKRG